MNTLPLLGCRPIRPLSPALKQRGATLFIALIALVSMTLAGIALVRSVDTSNLIAGNLAFRQAGLQASDTGVEEAFDALGTIVATSLDANWPSACAAGACNYYPTLQDTNGNGIPANIVWASVPYTPINASYKVKYVIDRLCTGDLPVTDIAGKCYASPLDDGSDKSMKIGVAGFSSAQMVYYRVTVRVEGPRNSVSMVQAILAR